MKTVKTLTINGQEYVVQDPSAVSVDPMQLDEEKQKQARSNIGAVGVPEVDSAAAKLINDKSVSPKSVWSSQNTVDKLCPAFTESGAVVTCEPVEGYPLEVVSHIQPGQAGSGDPSLDNIRLIVGHNEIKLTRCGKNLADTNRAVLRDGKTKMPVVDNGVVWKAGNTYFFYILFEQPIPAGTKVTATWKSQSDSLGNGVLYWTLLKDNFGTMTSGVGNGQSVTATVPAYGLYLAKTNGSTPLAEDITISNIMVSIDGGVYEPFKASETLIAKLGQTVYGGSYNWKTGELTVEYGIQDLSALVWYGPEVAYSYPIYYTDPFPAAASLIAGGRKGWCSVFNCLNGITLGSLPNNSLAYSIREFSSQSRVYIRADEIADVDALMAVLEGQTLVYQLAEPITIQLTPREVLALQGVNTLYGDTGDITVTGRADPTAINNHLQNRLAALEAALVNNT